MYVMAGNIVVCILYLCGKRKKHADTLGFLNVMHNVGGDKYHSKLHHSLSVLKKVCVHSTVN